MTLDEEGAVMYFEACNQDFRAEQESVCCCGSDMNAHGWWDGHSPVSSWDWALTCYLDSRMPAT